MIDAEKVRQAIAAFLKKPAEKVLDPVPLADLVTESFVLVEMVIELQESFGVRFNQEDLNKVKTVGDLLGLIESRASS